MQNSFWAFSHAVRYIFIPEKGIKDAASIVNAKKINAFKSIFPPNSVTSASSMVKNLIIQLSELCAINLRVLCGKKVTAPPLISVTSASSVVKKLTTQLSGKKVTAPPLISVTSAFSVVKNLITQLSELCAINLRVLCGKKVTTPPLISVISAFSVVKNLTTQLSELCAINLRVLCGKKVTAPPLSTVTSASSVVKNLTTQLSELCAINLRVLCGKKVTTPPLISVTSAFSVVKNLIAQLSELCAINLRVLCGKKPIALALTILLITPIFTKAQQKQKYKVAVIDLMILKRQKISAIPLAKELNADGLEIDMGGLGDRETFDSKLNNDSTRQEYIAKAKEQNIEFCSIAMTGFYAQSFAERPTWQKMIGDCLATAKAMNIKVVFLPLGVKGDLIQHPELRPAIVERLKIAGKMAKKAGVTIGIETSLDATAEKQLLKDICSKNVKSYFNFSNPLKEGRDLNKELKILGKKYIVQIHATDEDGVWLENNKRLDMYKVKQTLHDMKWKGWLVVERSRDATQPRNVKANFSANVAYLKKVFQD